MPADYDLTVDRLLNEFIQIKKGSGRDFYARDYNRTSNNCNHCMEVPRGNVDPDTRARAKSVSKMILDDSVE